MTVIFTALMHTSPDKQKYKTHIHTHLSHVRLPQMPILSYNILRRHEKHAQTHKYHTIITQTNTTHTLTLHTHDTHIQTRAH